MEQDHLEIPLEDIRGKFELVLEGHEAIRQEIRGVEERLGARIGQADFSIKTLNTKIDTVRDESNQKHEQTTTLLKTIAKDLAAHRADPEAHPRWQVREPSE